MMNFLADYGPMGSLLFFFGVFVWIAVRTYRPSAKATLQHFAFIPLKEDSHD